MKTIFKYGPLPSPGEKGEYELPIGGRIIHIGNDPQGVACIWVLHDPNKGHQYVDIACVGTGQTMYANYWYIGTLMVNPFVWHYFITNPEDVILDRQR